MKPILQWCKGAGVVAALTLAGAVQAQGTEEKLPDRFSLRLGGYNVRNADTVMRLDANNAPVGTFVDFHDTLGGENSATVLRLDGLYRFNENHAVGFGWYDLKLKGSRTLARDIEWGGQTYAAGAQVDSQLKFDTYKLNYQYSLFHNEQVELGVLVGVHVMRTSAGITATGATQSQNQSQAVTAPLPVWGLYGSYNFTLRFSAFYSYQMFNINYQDRVSGGLQDFLVGMEYRLFRNFGLGLAYNRFSLNMKAKGDNATLYLDTAWNGGMLYGTVYF